MKTSTLLLSAVFLVGSASLARADSPKVIRHLIYDFNSDIMAHTVRDSAALDNADGSGMSGWGSAGDSGTVTVDVVAVQSDGGLVVNISQQGHENRSAPVATCVVYGTTSFICDPSKRVIEEEAALLRLLGRSFVNPAQIDSSNHWRIGISNDQASNQTDFQITGNANGLLRITENRVVKSTGLGASTDTTEGTISYDTRSTVPKTIDETRTSRVQRAQGLYSTDTFRIVLNLVTDSMAAKP